MKRFLFAALLLVCTGLSAQDWGSPEFESMIRTYVKQRFSVNGRVFGVDEFEPEPYPLQGAHVKLTCLGDTTVFDGSAVDPDGRFWVEIWNRSRLKDTRFRVEISYLGMETFDSVFSVKKEKVDGVDTYEVHFDSLVMHSNPMTVEEVEIVAELQRMYQRGDTVIFNADAYEMPTGSVLLDLVRRLPGLQYQDGKMSYLGRSIEEIRLNGDEFFKRDMSIALNNMPTDKLKSLNVYEVPDDTLKASSDNHLVMDMKTKEPMDMTLFASVSAGTNEKVNRYSASVDASAWKKNGTQAWGSFTTSDIPTEYSYQLKSKRTNGSLSFDRQFDKVYVGVGGSYIESSSADRNDNYSKMFMPDFTQNSYSESESSNSSRNLNGNMWLNGNIGKNTHWNANIGMSSGRTGNGSNMVDSISNEGMGLVSATVQSNTSDSENMTYNMSASIYHSFGKDDRYNLNVDFGYNHDERSGVDVNESESRFVQLGDSVRKVKHRILTPGNDNSVRASVGLERSLGENGERGYMGLDYSFQYNKNTSVQNYEDMLPDGSLSAIDSLHYDKSDKGLDHGLELHYYYSDSLMRINVRGSAHPVNNKVDNLQYGNDEHLTQKGVRYNASANLRLRLFKKSSFTIGYNCRNGLPSATQLSTVTDYRDPMNIHEGNRNLKNSFTQNANLEIQLRSWMRATFSMGNTYNQITTLTRLDRETGARRTSPTNINGAWNMSEYLFLTYPFSDVSVSLTANHSLSHNVSYVQSFTDSDPKTSATDWHQTSFNLSSAYSNAHWVLEGNASFSMDKSKSDYLTTSNGGKRVNARLSVSYESTFGLGAQSDCTYNKPFGYEMESANRSECIWNASVFYNFLKKKQATVTVQWRDILNSYNGFSASMNGTSWNESRQYGETSLFLITFSYRFNQFD